MVLIAGNFHLLTRFINSQGPCFLFAISWILRSKKILLPVESKIKKQEEAAIKMETSIEWTLISKDQLLDWY